MRLLADDQTAGRGGGLEPRRRVDHVADSQGLTSLVSADGDNRVSCVDRCSRRQIEAVRPIQPLYTFEDDQASTHGALGVISVRDGSAEQP